MKRKIAFSIVIQLISIACFGQISFTESGSSLVIVNYGITASYQKETVSTFVNSQYFEVKSNDRTVLIVKDYTLVSSPSSSSLSDLQGKVSLLLTISSSGGTLTETSTSTLTNKTMSGAANTFSNIPYSALTGTPTIPAAGVTASEVATLTNKTISGSANTLTNIAYSSLTGTPTIPTSTDYVDRTTSQTVAGLKNFSGSFTASSAVARAVQITPSLTAAANNDVLVGLDLAPTFTNGAFTGVGNYSIRHSSAIIPSGDNSVNMGTNSIRYANIYAVTLNGGASVLSVKTNAITGLTLYSTGRVGIQNGGTYTDDAVNQLQVGGNIKATQYRLSALNTAPASATATGTLGEIRFDASFVYLCTAANTWVRAALSTW